MTDLLKVDFKRFFKDKLLKVLLVLGVIFGTSTPFLMGRLSKITSELLELFGITLATANGQFFDAFSLSNNMGFVAPILIAIVICKDFRYGTIRNKIISGKSRTHIFLSMFITCATMLFGIMLLNALIALLVSLIYFPFQSALNPITLGYFMLSVVLELLLYLVIAAIVCLLCTVTKSSGAAVISYIAIVMIFSIVTGVLQIAQSILIYDVSKEFTLKVIEFLQKINIFNYQLAIGKGNSYNTTELIYMLVTPTVAIVLLLLLGIFRFNRKDLK